MALGAILGFAGVLALLGSKRSGGELGTVSPWLFLLGIALLGIAIVALTWVIVVAAIWGFVHADATRVDLRRFGLGAALLMAGVAIGVYPLLRLVRSKTLPNGVGALKLIAAVVLIVWALLAVVFPHRLLYRGRMVGRRAGCASQTRAI